MVRRYAQLRVKHLAPAAGLIDRVMPVDRLLGVANQEKSGAYAQEPDFARAGLQYAFEEVGVADGIRTHDNRNHNPGLYQLSYSHRCLVPRRPEGPRAT
jgi:hypothetical protein